MGPSLRGTCPSLSREMGPNLPLFPGLLHKVVSGWLNGFRQASGTIRQYPASGGSLRQFPAPSHAVFYTSGRLTIQPHVKLKQYSVMWR